MSDFLDRFVERQTDAAPVLQPRIPSRFEAVTGPRGGAFAALLAEPYFDPQPDSLTVDGILPASEPEFEQERTPVVTQAVAPGEGSFQTVHHYRDLGSERDNFATRRSGLSVPVTQDLATPTPVLRGSAGISVGGARTQSTDPQLQEFTRRLNALQEQQERDRAGARNQELLNSPSPRQNSTPLPMTTDPSNAFDSKSRRAGAGEQSQETSAQFDRMLQTVREAVRMAGAQDRLNLETARTIPNLKAAVNHPSAHAATQAALVPQIIPEALPRRDAAPPTAPTINVTIGRVEVKANQAPQPAAPRGKPDHSAVMTLSDYLQRRAAGALP